MVTTGCSRGCGAGASVDWIGQVLAKYQREFPSQELVLDRLPQGQDKTALSESAQRGFEVFTGIGRCSIIPWGGMGGFFDNPFHDNGYGD